MFLKSKFISQRPLEPWCSVAQELLSALEITITVYILQPEISGLYTGIWLLLQLHSAATHLIF
jgi:hypothetical protein